MKAIHDMIMEDHRISAKSTAIYLRISCDRVGAIIHNDLEMRKLAAKWIPKLLTTEQKRKRVDSSVAVLEHFARNESDFLGKLVMRHGSTVIILRQSNSLRNGGTVVPPSQRSSEYKGQCRSK